MSGVWGLGSVPAPESSVPIPVPISVLVSVCVADIVFVFVFVFVFPVAVDAVVSASPLDDEDTAGTTYGWGGWVSLRMPTRACVCCMCVCICVRAHIHPSLYLSVCSGRVRALGYVWLGLATVWFSAAVNALGVGASTGSDVDGASEVDGVLATFTLWGGGGV